MYWHRGRCENYAGRGVWVSNPTARASALRLVAGVGDRGAVRGAGRSGDAGDVVIVLRHRAQDQRDDRAGDEDGGGQRDAEAEHLP